MSGEFFYDIEYDEHFIYTLNLYNKASTTKINVQAELNNNSQYIETVFLKNMETDVSILIKEIIESENGIMLQRDNVRVKLLVFLENLYLRTKGFRENIQNVDEQRKLQRDAFFDVKYSQVISMVNPISDMDFHIFRGTKCEWVLAKVTDGDNLFISDNPANWYNLREFIFPLSFDKAIIIRPKATNQCFLYKETANKKYTVELSKRSVFISNLLQTYNSSLLIGDRITINRHLVDVSKLKNGYLKGEQSEIYKG